MTRLFLVLGAGLFMVAPGIAQPWCTPCPFSIGAGHNTIRFHNALVGGSVEFPNFRAQGGNVEGDRLWRVFPKELHWRASPRNCVVGFELPFKFHNWHASASYRYPGFELRRVKTTPEGYKVPDFDGNALHWFHPSNLPPQRVLPLDSYWLVKAWFGSGNGTPIGHEDIALVILAPAGVSSQDTAYTAWHAKGERYGKAPQPSFSGRYNAATRTTELLVPPLTVEPTEIGAGIMFHEGIVEFAATSSGGGLRSEGETHFGVGAFYNDLASAGGEFRIRMEDNILKGPNGIFGIPLVSGRRHSASAFLPGSECLLDVSPADPLFTLLIDIGQIKPWQERFRNTIAWENYYESDWIPFPADPALRGVSLLFTAVDYASPPFPAPFGLTANSVLVRFQ